MAAILRVYILSWNNKNMGAREDGMKQFTLNTFESWQFCSTVTNQQVFKKMSFTVVMLLQYFPFESVRSDGKLKIGYIWKFGYGCPLSSSRVRRFNEERANQSPRS